MDVLRIFDSAVSGVVSQEPVPEPVEPTQLPPVAAPVAPSAPDAPASNVPALPPYKSRMFSTGYAPLIVIVSFLGGVLILGIAAGIFTIAYHSICM